MFDKFICFQKSLKRCNFDRVNQFSPIILLSDSLLVIVIAAMMAAFKLASHPAFSFLKSGIVTVK